MTIHHERSVCHKVMATCLTSVSRRPPWPWALWLSERLNVNTPCYCFLDSGFCSFVSSVFQTQSLSHLRRNTAHPPFSTLSLFVFLFKSLTQCRDTLPRLSKFPHPWYPVPKTSFVLSGVMNVLKGQTASPHILKRKKYN